MENRNERCISTDNASACASSAEDGFAQILPAESRHFVDVKKEMRVNCDRNMLQGVRDVMAPLGVTKTSCLWTGNSRDEDLQTTLSGSRRS